MTIPKENSGKKKSKSIKILVLVFPSIVFGILGTFLLTYPLPDFHPESWEIILGVIILSVMGTLSGWVIIIMGIHE